MVVVVVQTPVTMPNTVEEEAVAQRIRAGKQARLEAPHSLVQAAAGVAEAEAAVLVRMVEPGAVMPQAGVGVAVRHRPKAKIIRLDAARAAAVRRAKTLPPPVTAACLEVEVAEGEEPQTTA
jgi:hypothetical protein